MDLYVLTGPTAVGKTQLGLDWAEVNGGEILSCDSTTFYRGMDIGTAKPTQEEMERVRHHGIDIVEVDDQYNVSRYIEYARGVLADIESRGKRVLVTGGSGFYLKCFFSAVVDDIEVPEGVREEVEGFYERLGLEGLLEKMAELNPDGVGDLDVRNPRRVLKALMRCMVTGKSYIEMKEAFTEKKGPFDGYRKHLTLLSRSEEGLKARIRERAELMLNGGLLEEVEGLLERGIKRNPSAASAIGYRETIEYLEGGGVAKEDLLERIVINTNRLVAKQRKWFRHQVEPDRVVELSGGGVVKLFFDR